MMTLSEARVLLGVPVRDGCFRRRRCRAPGVGRRAVAGTELAGKNLSPIRHYEQIGDLPRPCASAGRSADGDRSPVTATVTAEPDLLREGALLEGESLGVCDGQARQGQACPGQTRRVMQARALVPATAPVPGDVDVHPLAGQEDRSPWTHRRTCEVSAERRGGQLTPATRFVI